MNKKVEERKENRNMDMKIIGDKALVNLSDEAQFMQLIKKIDDETKIVEMDLKNLTTIYESSSGGSFAEAIKEQLSMDVPVEAVSDTLKSGFDGQYGSEMILVEGNGERSKRTAYLMSEFAVRTLIERVNARSSAIQNLPRRNLSRVLNEFLPNSEFKATALIRGHKIRSLRGENFVDLSQSRMLNGLKNYLNSTFEDVEFLSGEYTHNKTKAIWLLNSYNVLDDLNNILAVSKGGNYIPGVKFSTSDVGLEVAMINIAAIDKNGYHINLGTPIRIPHEGKSSVAEFLLKVKGIKEELDKRASALSGLTDIEIKYVGNTVMALMNKLRPIGKVDLKHAVSEYELKNSNSAGTAWDVFMILQDALDKMRKRNRSVISIESAEEKVAELLEKDFNWSKYDISLRKS